MTPELAAILGVGITLAGLLWQGLRNVNARIDRVETNLNARLARVEANLNARIDRVETALGARIDRIEEELREIRDRLSRLEGKMDFLEGYIVRRNEHPGAPAE
ncbi:MAG: hypothetical protein F4Y03_11385 [Alphaproteobacteria bacterium]|nr:hypothetical protein [Alphaproteobacteria bacterium]